MDVCLFGQETAMFKMKHEVIMNAMILCGEWFGKIILAAKFVCIKT